MRDFNKNKSTYNNKTCNFCKAFGHEEKDCRTKRRINVITTVEPVKSSQEKARAD